jgi:hypothetical protein
MLVGIAPQGCSSLETGRPLAMAYGSSGTSIFLIAVGAILRYAVTFNVSGVSIPTIGLILMIVGILGLVLSLLYLFAWSTRAAPQAPVEREYYDGPPRRRP